MTENSRTEGVRPQRIAVLGPGGVGGLLAGLLSRAGHDVTCVASESTAAVLKKDGVHVRSGMHGEFTAPVHAVTELTTPVDLLLIATKHTSLDSALARVPASAIGDALVVPLLNGIEHPEILRGVYPPEQVAAGAIRVESTRTAPGRIEHDSPFVDLDLASPTAPRERLDATVALLSDAGVRSRVLDDESSMLWGKLSFLAPFALLTTRYRMTVGEVRAHHEDELRALLEETTTTARACGASPDLARLLTMYDNFPGTAKSSMLRDAEAGRPLELDAIGGALLRAAGRHGVPVPVATRLVEALAAPSGT